MMKHQREHPPGSHLGPACLSRPCRVCDGVICTLLHRYRLDKQMFSRVQVSPRMWQLPRKMSRRQKELSYLRRPPSMSNLAVHLRLSSLPTVMLPR